MCPWGRNAFGLMCARSVIVKIHIDSALIWLTLDGTGSPTESVRSFQLNRPLHFLLCHTSWVYGFWVVRKPGANVKLLLIGGFVGLAIGVELTVLYFALAEFFAVNARVLNAKQKEAENGHWSAEDSLATDSRKAG
jgi:hypothetical protein